MRHMKPFSLPSLLVVLAVAGHSAPAWTQPPAQATVRRLSVEDAVRLALEQNLGIAAERLGPQIQDESVTLARAAWAPNLTSALQNSSQNSPSTSFLSGGQSKVTDGRFTTQLGVTQLLPTGGNYAVSWNNTRSTSTNQFSNYNPLLSSNVAFTLTQPLLRNRSIDTYRQQLAVSRADRDAADMSLRATIASTTRQVTNAYWDLVYTRENLKTQQQSLDLARRSLADNEKRVQIGTMAPIDIVEARSEVARNDEAVIVADAAIRQAEDRLRALIFRPNTPDFWSLSLEPTDALPFAPTTVNVDAAVARALATRSDVQLAKNSLERTDIVLRYYHSQVLPELNAQVAYQSNGVGGTLLSPLTSLPLGGTTTRSVLAERGLGSVVGDIFSSKYPTWTVGLSLSYPIGTSTQDAAYARARLQRDQADVQLQNLQLQVGTQVRDAARQVVTNQKRVDSARAARDLAEQRLAAEEKKFAAGVQVNFFVFQAQRDLAQARTNELRAVADYTKSLVDYEAVQVTALAGTAAVTNAASTASAVTR